MQLLFTGAWLTRLSICPSGCLYFDWNSSRRSVNGVAFDCVLFVRRSEGLRVSDVVNIQSVRPLYLCTDTGQCWYVTSDRGWKAWTPLKAVGSFVIFMKVQPTQICFCLSLACASDEVLVLAWTFMYKPKLLAFLQFVCATFAGISKLLTFASVGVSYIRVGCEFRV